jgi:hypothetical protein
VVRLRQRASSIITSRSVKLRARLLSQLVLTTGLFWQLFSSSAILLRRDQQQLV